MAEEASKLRGLEARVAALETKFNFLLQFIPCQRWPRLYQLQEGQPSTFLGRPGQSLGNSKPLPIPVSQLYTLLVKKKMITPVGQRTRIGPQPKDYNKDLTCEYHQGEVGHTVENCRVLRHRIQDLLDQGVLKFRIEGVINAIGQGWKELKEDFEEFCEKEERRIGEAHTSHTTGDVQSPIQWSSNTLPKKRSCFRQLQSGRCYTPEELEKRRKEIGKTVEDPAKTKVAEDEAADFLRIIKSSEYSVVKQLSKMPSHISVLALLLASESSQESSTERCLNEAYVPEDITGPSFENMGANRQWVSSKRMPSVNLGKARHRPHSCEGQLAWSYELSMEPAERETMVAYGRSSTLLPTPEDETHHWQPIEWQPLNQGLSRAGIMVAKRICQGRISARARYGLGYTPRLERTVRWLMKPGRQRAAAKLRGEKWPEKKMVIPHIRTTFPASAMFQVDEGDVDELALLFAEDLNVNAITTEGDSTAFPIHPDQYEEPTRVCSHLVLSAEEYCLLGGFGKSFPGPIPPQPSKTPPSNIITTTAEEEYAGPMVEGLSIHTITEEEDSTTTPPTRHCQQGEEAKTWTCVPLLQRVSSSNEITRKTSNDPHVSKIDNKTNCSLDNIDNSDEEIELPNDILEALERQDEGSKPNIEELEIVNLANEGEEPREVKIGTRCTTEQKEALIALLREFHEIFAWSYQDMPGLDTDIVVHKIPLKPECKPVKQALRRMKPEVILKIKEEVEKQLKAGFLSTVTYSDWVANIVPVPKKDGKVRINECRVLIHGRILRVQSDQNGRRRQSPRLLSSHIGEPFVYDVMPFGLKNAGATYQRAMVTLFHDMIHHEIEVYVDDMIAKSRTAQDHLTDLRKLFQRLKKYQLRLNPNKCAFGVTSGKLLGFIVSGRGIEIDPAKVQAIRSMPAPKTEKEIRSFLGRINYIARFIAQLTATCEPLFKLLRKDVKIKWTEDCQKSLLTRSRIQEASMGCMLGQQDETGKKEQAIYYLSKKFTEPETRYLLVEKTCCALAWASKKLRQYMLYYTTWLVSRMDPIKYIFEKPALTGKIARWQVLLSEVRHLICGLGKAIKGQAIADYLADYPSEQWKLYFDGAANAVGSGIGAVLVSPKGQQTPIAVKLGFDCTNNMTEYEACIVGLQAALEFGAYELEVFGDSLLIVSQTNGEWQARDPKLIPYQRYISRLVPKFKYVTFTYTPRAHNHFADALATLASLIKLVEGDDVRPLRIETRDIPAYCVCIEECMNVEAEIDNKPWYYDIKRFIQDREYPPRATENEKKMQKEANRLIPRDARGIDGSPCQRTLPGPEDYESWLLLVDNGEGLHQTCPDVPQMPDVSEQQERTSPISSHYGLAVAFSAWGMDWVEACSFKNVTQVAVTRFVKNNIICRYGMPEMLITDNASNLNNRMMDQLCQQFKIQHHNSAPYRPKMNGAVEAANKNVKKILSKMTETYKDWHEHLPYALCAYRTSVRTSVGATPYSLVYGMEAVLPVEVEIPSLRILSQTQLEEAEWAQARYEQLNFIDEKRLAALCHGQLYQRRIERAYNKKARPRTFQPGDLVLKKRNMALSDPRGKFAPSYEGPYVVKKAFSGRSNHSG
uniref:Uncharacterized protein n=1 Tax=Fagus sylvatica TaxID=28930 RepID=A0A2N9IH86_FAGSY